MGAMKMLSTEVEENEGDEEHNDDEPDDDARHRSRQQRSANCLGSSRRCMYPPALDPQ